MKDKLKRMLAVSLSAIVVSQFSHAGSMGDVSTDMGTFLLFEAGANYSYNIYQNNIVAPESYTIFTPKGLPYNGGSLYANNFWGGYMELSLFRDTMLYNVRYDMFAVTTKTGVIQDASGPLTFANSLSPAKLSLTVDKTWTAMEAHALTYGVGAGVVISTYNKGKFLESRPITYLYNGKIVSQDPNDAILGRTIAGRGRIDPLVEGLVMYKLTDHLNMRWNVAYQIPVDQQFTNGSINTNLGINYALPL